MKSSFRTQLQRKNYDLETYEHKDNHRSARITNRKDVLNEERLTKYLKIYFDDKILSITANSSKFLNAESCYLSMRYGFN